MSIDAVDARWDQFLVKARERFVDILTESIDDCEALLDSNPHDVKVVLRAWTAMRIRARGVRDKLDEVWIKQVCEHYDAEGELRRAAAASARGQALADWMDIELYRTETRVFADVVRRLLACVEAEFAKLSCEHCDHPLRPKLTLRPIEGRCRRCGALNHIEPSATAKLAIELGPHLWREACWELWIAKQQAELIVRRSDDVTLAQLKAWEQAEIEYLCAWLHERAKLLPEPEGTNGEQLRHRLEHLYARLERESVWIRAGSPRAV